MISSIRYLLKNLPLKGGRWGDTPQSPRPPKILDRPNGIPGQDTSDRVFARIKPEQFQQCFLDWMQTVEVVTKGQVVPIDGKKLRRSHDKSNGQAAIHMVSAWAGENRMVLGQVKVDDKSNEITAIPQLLELLDLNGWPDKTSIEYHYYLSSLTSGAKHHLEVPRTHWAIENELHFKVLYSLQTPLIDHRFRFGLFLW